MCVMPDCLPGIDGLYNPLLLGAVNDTQDLAASTMDFAPGMFAPGMCWTRCLALGMVLGR